MRPVNSILASFRTAYLSQGQLGRIALPVAFLLEFCCLCSTLVLVLRSRAASGPLPGPIVVPTQSTQATPTALFRFDTLTPLPTTTAFVPTAFPTLTPVPTATTTSTPTLPPATATPVPTITATATPTEVNSVLIVSVDKVAEFVEIQNLTQAAVNLRGWRLVSERGSESCTLRGTLEPNEVLRIWARRGDPGFDCRLGREIWADNELDPAVLYDSDGQEVSRYP
jgi:hypothetical protein